MAIPRTGIPEPLVKQTSGWADESRCAECHEQANEFPETGHARALRRATDPELLELLMQLNDSPISQAHGIRVEPHGDHLVVTHDREEGQRTARLDWCFGSGTHARTWVGLLDGSWGSTDVLEFRWSWFAKSGEFARTPGQPEHVDAGYFGGLGVLYDHPKARRCFSCHATVLPDENGHIDSDKIVPGIGCQRCHGPRQSHIDSGGELSDWTWRELDQHESVRRCADCHRAAEEREPHEIYAGNPEIVRFQPMGLMESACFLGDSRLTCVTCHDPHRPLSEQNSQGRWQCIQCHDASAGHGRDCTAGHLDNCIDCHMPTVPWVAGIEFRDHWIRVPEADE